MDKFYHLSVESRNNSISQKKLITKISNLRSGDFIDIVGALGIIGTMIIWLPNDWNLAFQPNPNAIISPHLQWLYGNQQSENHFGYRKATGRLSKIYCLPFDISINRIYSGLIAALIRHYYSANEFKEV